MKKIYLILWILLNPILLIAYEEKILLLDEFIKVVSKKETIFNEILIDELYLKYKKKLNLPPKDFILSVKSQYNLMISPSDGEFGNSISLNKLFPFKGTELLVEYNSFLNKTSRDVNSSFSIEVFQPIAENAFGKGTKLQNLILELEIDIIRFQIAEAYEDYFSELIKIYYSWHSSFENLKTGQNSYKKNIKLLENVKEREKSRIALPIDVNKINLQVLEKKENLITLENKFEEYSNLVKKAMRYKGDEFLIPANSSLYNGTLIEFEKEYRKFKKESRTSKILLKLKKKNIEEVNKYADALLPSINLFGGCLIDGEGHGFKESEQSVFFGVSLELPLQKKGTIENAHYETSKINLEKLHLSSENIHIRLYTNLKNLYLQIKREENLIAILDEKIKLAEAIVEDETKNYSLGKVTLKDLIDEVNKLEDNKFNKIIHQIQLKKFVIEWLRLTDKLITENKSYKNIT